MSEHVPYRHPDPSVPVDELGRAVPHRLRALAVLSAVPGAAQRFDREVPGRFIEPVPGGQVEGTVRIRCVCGSAPELSVGEFEVCDCGRAFIWTGGRMLVAQPESA